MKGTGAYDSLAEAPAASRAGLMRMGDAMIVYQTACVAAGLGIADLIEGVPRTTAELAR